MFTVTGKLSNGQVIRGPVNTTSYSAVASAVESKIPADVTLNSLSIKRMSQDNGLKVAEPRKRKEAAAPATPPAPSKRK